MKSFMTRSHSMLTALRALIGSVPPATPHISAHCTNIHMLLMHLCDFDRVRYAYILKWLAYPLRHPGAKMRYGLAIKAEKGTGASLFFHQVALALHQGAGRAIDIGHFGDQFNEQWAGAPLLLVDGFPQVLTAHLKSLLTSETITIRRKGKTFMEVPNHMNFIFLSGAHHALPAGTDRRFMVLETPPRREALFYQAVASEIKDGGVDAFRYFLMHGIDLGGFNETTIPPGFERTEPSEVCAESLHLAKEAA
jgi:putative DNA primase/helicase